MDQDPTLCVGKAVVKKSCKPFKSGQKTNTVKSVGVNPHTDHPAFAFVEDDSLVDTRQCELEAPDGAG